MFVCVGCPGCETNLVGRDIEYELELEALMQERPDGNIEPPKNTAKVWHVTKLRMVPTPRGRGYFNDMRPRGITTPRSVEYMNQRVTNALRRARE